MINADTKAVRAALMEARLRIDDALALLAGQPASEHAPEAAKPKPRRLTNADIEAGKSLKGGFKRETLEGWGVPWPPPAGWRSALLRGEPMPERAATDEPASEPIAPPTDHDPGDGRVPPWQ